MRRTSIFLILLASGIVSYAATTITSLLLRTQQNTGNMMGGMMGGVWESSSLNPYSSTLTFLTITAIALASVGATGLLYTTIKPEPQVVKPEQLSQLKIAAAPKNMQIEKSASSTQDKRINDALKILKPDELQIVNLLREHDGKYLQKWIAKDLGMSRLQIHRIVSKLAERKLVTLQKTGNTNEVTLVKWLCEDDSLGSP